MQLPKLLLTLFAVSSLGCGPGGPAVKICVSDPEREGLTCFDSKTQAQSFLLYKESENYVCVSPNDFKTVLNFCKENKP